jgi:glyoxylase-like metal-dependent hydrolase (beta-lactamase superfamily II)
MTTTNRRSVLKAGLGGLAGLASAPLLGALAGCGPSGARLETEALGDRITLVKGAPGNLVALSGEDGIVLVDSGAADMAASVKATLGGRVRTVFNTHYHADQTGGNALFGRSGAKIHAHVITRQWLSANYYVPGEDRWVAAPPAAARPTETFRLRGEMTAGGESIAYGYLLEAHTRGDIYVLFRDSNVLAVGDVASPLRDPGIDWYAGGWLGGRVDAMDDLLELANEETKVVPAYGPVMSRADLQAERDMMLQLYDRTTFLTTKGHDAQDMLDVGVMDEVERRFEDPYRFLHDVCKGHWAHYTNFGGATV